MNDYHVAHEEDLNGAVSAVRQDTTPSSRQFPAVVRREVLPELLSAALAQEGQYLLFIASSE